MKTLVIFNLIPDEQQMTVVDMTQDEFDYFSQAHQYTVNVDEWDDEKVDIVDIVSNAFCENEEQLQYCDGDKAREYFMKWKCMEVIPTDLSSIDKMLVFSHYL